MWLSNLVVGENKVNSYSNQLKLNQVFLFGLEFDNNKKQAGAELCQAQQKLEIVEFWFGIKNGTSWYYASPLYSIVLLT